ncbi:putative bifunctional diguanylate cyclase/phosphodiesterase [Azospira restricta]|uniref:EAL domain-containing protein n=1 Tax=Azospira restricta TaxID=404405 RepID=A0A974PW22_9RHOO|nr:EAL domain-containing protein [Azospira restricta]QRJ62401.1 EAL domain-containing protein [Azospira restricta]
MVKLMDVKIWVRLVVSILLAVIVSGAGLIHWATLEQRKIAEEQARDIAMSVHQVTLAGLTGMMITGTISLRSIFLDQIKETNHIESIKVFRSEAVVKQYGPGLEGEIPTDPAEHNVLRHGTPQFDVFRGKDGSERLRAVIPAIASENYLGKNCTFCHEVTPGTVLGAVSMEVSLAKAHETVREFSKNALIAAAALCVPLGLFIWFFTSRLVTRPMRRMTEGLQRIAAGDIDDIQLLPERGRDEVGLATTAFNRVMGKAYELIQQQRLSRIVFDSSLEGITVTDARARIQMVNKAFSDTTGYSAEEAIGQTPALLKSGKQGEEFYHEFWKVLSEKGEWRGEIWNRRKNGSIYAEWLNISAVRNKRGEVEHYVAIFSDITERKQREEMITFQAFHDGLTKLPNRILFRDRLEQALMQAKRHKTRTPAVMFLDLDRFKQINDTFGHDAGDLLLKEVAARLRQCVRGTDTVARLAGDEFTVLLPEISEESDAQAVATKILAAMQVPIDIGPESRVVTTSIGIAMYPRDGRDVDTLMKRADAAMYSVKGSGRASVAFFSPELVGMPSRHAEMEARLRQAVLERSFVLHYQPIFDLQSGAIHGQEALLRWQVAADELVLPEEFLPLAEETGLIVKIGEWVLESACLQARAWQGGDAAVAIAVNLSAPEFRRPDLVEMVRNTLKRTGVSPQLLELEISESLAMQDVDYAARTIRALADLGVGVSLDDFGTGYSNMTALRRLPVSALKIDRSLLIEHGADPAGYAILTAIFGVAHALALRIVAEGVETEGQLAVLRELACSRVQGNLLGAPVKS